MKKLFTVVLLLITFVLSACSGNESPEAALASDTHSKYRDAYYPRLPPELKDCKAFKVDSSKDPDVIVFRCPNSTTTTTAHIGKQYVTTIVIDGVEYKAVPKQTQAGE